MPAIQSGLIMSLTARSRLPDDTTADANLTPIFINERRSAYRYVSGGIIKGLKNRALESIEGLCYNLKSNPDDEEFGLKNGVNTQVL